MNGSGEFAFASINDIEVYENQIFILDKILKKIHRVKLDGGELLASGEITLNEGRGPAEITNPVDIAVSESMIFIADAGSQKIIIINNDGEFVNEFLLPFRPTRIYYEKVRKNILISGFWPTFRGNLIHIFDLQGKEMSTIVNRPDNWVEIAQTGNFERIVATPEHIFVSYPYPLQIVKYDWGGSKLATWQDDAYKSEILDEEDYKLIDSRIISLQKFQEYILSLVQIDDSYELQIFSKDLNKIDSISGEIFEAENLSMNRSIENKYLIFRQMGIAPYLILYSIEVD
jgi:hypothetical protein